MPPPTRAPSHPLCLPHVCAQDAARLFDLFLSSHPLMPLYVGSVAMRAQREVLMSCEEMPELHTALVNMRITRCGRRVWAYGHRVWAYRVK